MKLIAKVTLRVGGERLPPGAEVVIDDERECARLIDRGFAVEAAANETEANAFEQIASAMPDVEYAPALERSATDAAPDGSLSEELTGDGSGEALPEITNPEPPKARKKGRR